MCVAEDCNAASACAAVFAIILLSLGLVGYEGACVHLRLCVASASCPGRLCGCMSAQPPKAHLPLEAERRIRIQRGCSSAGIDEREVARCSAGWSVLCANACKDRRALHASSACNLQMKAPSLSTRVGRFAAKTSPYNQGSGCERVPRNSRRASATKLLAKTTSPERYSLPHYHTCFSMLSHAAGRLSRVTSATAFRRIYTASVCQGFGSHVSDNNPEMLEEEKQKSLKGEVTEGNLPVST